MTIGDRDLWLLVGDGDCSLVVGRPRSIRRRNGMAVAIGPQSAVALTSVTALSGVSLRTSPWPTTERAAEGHGEVVVEWINIGVGDAMTCGAKGSMTTASGSAYIAYGSAI